MTNLLAKRAHVARWRQMGLTAAGLLVLCSCRGPAPAPHGPAPQGSMNTLPPQAWTGAPGDGYTVPGAVAPGAMAGHLQGPPVPVQTLGPWAPPGIARPWPTDEYLHDGGDQAPLVKVGADWRVHGLQLEDTVVHYDTLDGCTVVEPTNRVHLYAPRFAAVRKIEYLRENDQLNRVVAFDTPVGLRGHDESLLATTSMQQLQPISEIGTRRASQFLDREQAGSLDTRLYPVAFQDSLMPYEDLAIIRNGIYEQADKARLAESFEAAIVWSHDLGVQVAIERRQAAMAVNVQTAQLTYSVELPGCPRLQVCKVASSQHAKPGETVDFTIRFDNVGEQKMGNVTIVDNLTTRLEYVPDSAQSSVPANFGTQLNEGDSLVLRWEIIDPLEPGEGGVVRFRCKVR